MKFAAVTVAVRDELSVDKALTGSSILLVLKRLLIRIS